MCEYADYNENVGIVLDVKCPFRAIPLCVISPLFVSSFLSLAMATFMFLHTLPMIITECTV